MRKTKGIFVKAALQLLALMLIFSTFAPGYTSAESKGMSKNSGNEEGIIDAKLLDSYKEDEFARFIIILKEQADTEKAAFSAKAEGARKELSMDDMEAGVKKSVVNALQQTAERTQKSLLSALEKEKKSGRVKDYQNYFIVNAIAVTGTEKTVRQLAGYKE